MIENQSIIFINTPQIGDVVFQKTSPRQPMTIIKIQEKENFLCELEIDQTRLIGTFHYSELLFSKATQVVFRDIENELNNSN